MDPQDKAYPPPERRSGFDKARAEANGRPARNWSVFPSASAIVFTWLVLVVLLTPLWGR